MGEPFGSNQGSYPGAGSQSSGPGGFRGYEYYQSQVDPEELFRKIFGDAFSRGGFGNHEWANDAEQNGLNNQRISQVYSFSSFLLFLFFRYFSVSS